MKFKAFPFPRETSSGDRVDTSGQVKVGDVTDIIVSDGDTSFCKFLSDYYYFFLDYFILINFETNYWQINQWS